MLYPIELQEQKSPATDHEPQQGAVWYKGRLLIFSFGVCDHSGLGSRRASDAVNLSLHCIIHAVYYVSSQAKVNRKQKHCDPRVRGFNGCELVGIIFCILIHTVRI